MVVCMLVRGHETAFSGLTDYPSLPLVYLTRAECNIFYQKQYTTTISLIFFQDLRKWLFALGMHNFYSISDVVNGCFF